MATPCDSYAWDYRELIPLLNLTESSAEGGFEPLIIGSMCKYLIIVLSHSDSKTLASLDHFSLQPVHFLEGLKKWDIIITMIINKDNVYPG